MDKPHAASMASELTRNRNFLSSVQARTGRTGFLLVGKAFVPVEKWRKNIFTSWKKSQHPRLQSDFAPVVIKSWLAHCPWENLTKSYCRETFLEQKLRWKSRNFQWFLHKKKRKPQVKHSRTPVKERKHWHWDEGKEKFRQRNWGSNPGHLVLRTSTLTTELSHHSC